MSIYADGIAVGIAQLLTAFSMPTGFRGLLTYETPTATVGIAYAEGFLGHADGKSRRQPGVLV